LKQLTDKYKTQKRGLMQKMLTGEWRVRGFATSEEV
jgi:type I restriction enzyme, S subunit